MARKLFIQSLHDRCGRNKFQFAKQLRENPTSAEAALWRVLRMKQMEGAKFRRQNVLFGWIADFWCNGLKLVVEVDGSSHAEKAHEDAKRDAVLLSHGIMTVRVTNREVLTCMPSVIKRLKCAIKDRRIELSTQGSIRAIRRREPKVWRWPLEGPRLSAGLAVASGSITSWT